MNEVMIPPMVGREDSIGRLQDIAEKVLHGDGEVVFIAGEAGIGKTRLVEEFEKIAVDLGFQVLVGRCIPGTPAPYLPFQEAFQKFFKKTDMGLVGFLLGKEFDYSSSFELKTGSEKTLFSMLEFLRKLSTKNPVTLVIEDLQWVDSASIQIIHFIARNCHGLRMLIIGTYRSEEVRAVSGCEHPFMENLRVMRREGICKEINLQELTRDQVKIAIEGMLGGAISNYIVQKISAECGGNPLFIVETLRLLKDINALSRKDGFWQLKEGAAIEIPSTVKEVILRRIEKISKEERRILDCGAVIGERFEPTIIERCLGLSELDLLETLELIEKRSQLVMSKDGLYQFGHELVRRALYDQISPMYRKALHRTVGEILERHMPSEQNIGTISMHFYHAGMKDKCIKYSLLAGESCFKKWACLESIPFFAMVLELSKDDSKMLAERMHALEMLGNNYRILLKSNIAFDYYQEFLKLCKAPRDRVRVLVKLAFLWDPTRLGRGGFSKMKELLKEAEDAPEIDLIDRGYLLRMRFYCHLREGKYLEAAHDCEQAAGIFRNLGELDWLETTLTDHALVFLNQGNVKGAEEKTSEAEKVYLESRTPISELDVIFQKGANSFYGGEYGKSLSAFTKVEEIFRTKSIDLPYVNFMTHYLKSLLYDSLGDYDKSMEQALKSQEIAINIESDYYTIYSCIIIAHTKIQMGQIDEATIFYKEAIERSGAFEWEARTSMRGLLAMIKAELDAAEGKVNPEAFENAFEFLSQGNDAILYGAIARRWYGRILEKQGLHNKAKEQYLKSIEFYQVLGNEAQIQMITKLIK